MPPYSLFFASQVKPHMWWPHWEETAKPRCGGAISHHWCFVLGADLHTGAYWREENTLTAIRRKRKGWCWFETGAQPIRHPFSRKIAPVIVSEQEHVSSLQHKSVTTRQQINTTRCGFCLRELWVLKLYFDISSSWFSIFMPLQAAFDKKNITIITRYHFIVRTNSDY